MATSKKQTATEILTEDREERPILLDGHASWAEQRRLDQEAKQRAMFEDLYEPFPQEMERTLVKGGTALTYIPVSEVITRLNRVFGVCGWSSVIMRCERDERDPDFIVAHVRLSIDGDFDHPIVTKDGFGGQKIKRTKNGDIVDLGDEFKGAISDALKKAAQQLGIGLYLARDPDAIELEQAIYADANPTAKTQTEEMYAQFMELRNTLTPEQVEELRSYWKTWSGGRPVPKSSEFKVEELDALIVECTRLLMGAEYVVPSSEDAIDD